MGYPLIYLVNTGSLPLFHSETNLYLANKGLGHLSGLVCSLFGRYFVSDNNFWAFFGRIRVFANASDWKKTSKEREMAI